MSSVEDKAKELVGRYDLVKGVQGFVAAKRCALIAVREIIYLPVFWDGTDNPDDLEGTREFWEQVFEKIKQL